MASAVYALRAHTNDRDLVSFCAALPFAASAAIVAPFGLDSRAHPLTRLLSLLLIVSPLILLFAGIHALALVQTHGQMKMSPLVAFAVAAGADLFFWLGAFVR
jgi:hypothetical protein